MFEKTSPWGCSSSRQAFAIAEEGSVSEKSTGTQKDTTIANAPLRPAIVPAVPLRSSGTTTACSGRTTSYPPTGSESLGPADNVPSRWNAQYQGSLAPLTVNTRGGSTVYGRGGPPVPLTTGSRSGRYAPSWGGSNVSTMRSGVYQIANTTNKISKDPATLASHTGPRRILMTAQRDWRDERTQYEPGMIIYASMHEPHKNYNPVNPPTDRSTTQSAFGPVYSKERPMIVVSMHEKHYVAIPCFTYQGKGPEARIVDEVVTIHDHRSSLSPTQPSTHRPLVTAYMYPNSQLLSPATTVHFAYPICRAYSSSCIREGRLTAESRDDLIKLYRESLPRPLVDEELKLKIRDRKKKAASLTKAANTAVQALKAKKNLTAVAAQWVQPLDMALTAETERADALKEVIAAMESTNLGKDEMVQPRLQRW